MLLLPDKLFELLEATQGCEQEAKHHPEGDVFTHLLQVFEAACRETDDIDLLLAALLHDVGKVAGRKTHVAEGLELLKDYATTKTLWLIEQHMRVWDWLLGDMKRHGKITYLADHPWLPELVQLARWDKMGRVPGKKPAYSRELVREKLEAKALKHFDHPPMTEDSIIDMKGERK